jgi:hypothetical protein
MNLNSKPFQKTPSEIRDLMTDKPKMANMSLFVQAHFKKQMKVYCAEQGISISKLIVRVLTKHMGNCSKD